MKTGMYVYMCMVTQAWGKKYSIGLNWIEYMERTKEGIDMSVVLVAWRWNGFSKWMREGTTWGERREDGEEHPWWAAAAH